MKKTAAIYARVSSERQKEEGTIASQTALLLEYAKAHELSVPAEWIFEDEGYSGATLARPGLERLRDLAAEGQIEVVLIYAPDRLSRKYAYQVLLTEEFCRHGVETIFLKSAAAQTPEERLMLQFQGVSDLRQSRRLVGGVAAQSRMALRAVIPPPPCCQRLGPSSVPSPPKRLPACGDSTPHADQRVCAPQDQPLVVRVLHNPKLSPSLPGDIPGTVKLWESPRQSRGFP
jgi:hypothetical protein